jgi:hypothetical protein
MRQDERKSGPILLHRQCRKNGCIGSQSEIAIVEEKQINRDPERSTPDRSAHR